ncbi:hypothetical protein ACXR8F_04770 [Terrabacter sp. AAH1]|nr:hypothetical protein UB45_05435 [Terrabacter sp. 28]
MSQWFEGWSEADVVTLRFGPVWVLSALTGRTVFDDDERGAFWDAVTDAALRSTGAGRAVFETAASERRWLFDEFALDGRPVVSGLLAVTRLLERLSAEARDDVRLGIVRVGAAVALARGPFGRRMTTEDEQTLVLVDELLRTSKETAEDNPMNSPAAI